MPHKGPHISLPDERLIKRVLRLTLEEFQAWPQSLQDLALKLAAEIFMIRYNPFIPSAMIWKSVQDQLEMEKSAQSPEYFQLLGNCLENYWKRFLKDRKFRNKLVSSLQTVLPKEYVVSDPNVLIECSTDATDLRMELPILVLFPENTNQIQGIIRLANEIGFAIVPRGGGSGATGGAVPASRRTVILSMSRMKNILNIDAEQKILCCQAGVITLDAIKAVDQKGLLFTVDPASKAASSLGGNVSENAGGPAAFEYGTTIDNILSYKIVMPTGSLWEVKRKNHPWHKIMPDETAVFEIFDENQVLQDTIALSGGQIRKAGLGKDVTNKFLGGLPGIQKEGVDGIITEACFTLHPKQGHSRTLCLEFFGNSMRNAMLVIKDVVGLRDTIREEGDLVKISALEEFGSKYVQAIDYSKKSTQYEGEPISVLLLQLDSDSEAALQQAVNRIVDIVTPYDKVDIFVAKTDKEAEIFWHDRHQLSAIARRTSGFKINEDIVIPLQVIPEFSDFIEGQNLIYLAKAYRLALKKVTELDGVDVDDEFIQMELEVIRKITTHTLLKDELPEQEFQVQIPFFFQDLKSRYPHLKKELEEILEEMFATRIIIANHMHAGDGNCHVNIPVNSNDPFMLHQAEEAAGKIFKKVLSLNGEVSGEHGIGITKINFLDEKKMEAIKAYKAEVDPYNVFNPGKLTQRDLLVMPYTFSFNRLILDIQKTALPGKESLISLLKGIQTCTRCGKCKQVCPMYQPEQGMMFHPRNKNISLGALVEALYYTQLMTGKPDNRLLQKLSKMMEHCTACGKCMAICPVKIDSAHSALSIRSYLEEKGAGGHPIKAQVLKFLSRNPQATLPKAAKAVSLGQHIQNKVVNFVPSAWREKISNPLFRGQGPEMEWQQLAESLDLKTGSIFVPAKGKVHKAILYFPGCGAGLFHKSIGLAALQLLLQTNTAVILPPKHLCCGYPLEAAGSMEAFERIGRNNIQILNNLITQANQAGLDVTHILTSCGTCREGIQNYNLRNIYGESLVHQDIVQYLLEILPPLEKWTEPILYHASCHAEWTGVPPLKSGEKYALGLQKILGQTPQISPGCCGESGMGAITSPRIYNRIRSKKQEQLGLDLTSYDKNLPIIVGCPSCKIGISRSLLEMNIQREVLHTVEFLAQLYGGPDWKQSLLSKTAGNKIINGKREIDALSEH